MKSRIKLTQKQLAVGIIDDKTQLPDYLQNQHNSTPKPEESSEE